MRRCVYCQGQVIPLGGRCRQCHRRQPPAPLLQLEKGEGSTEVLTNSEQGEDLPGEVRLPLPATPPRRRLSRRTMLKVAGVAGVGLGVGLAGREVYLLAQLHPLLTYRGHDAEIWNLAWSPDSRWIASTSGAEVQVWEALSGRLIHHFPDQQGSESVAWSPDGAYLASGSWDHTISVWQVATGQKVLTYRGHTQEQAFASVPHAALAEWAAHTRLLPSSLRPFGITSLAWSPDGTRLISSGGDDTTQVWEALTGKPLLRFGGIQDYYEAGAWSPDGQHLLIRTKRGIERHLATTGALEFTFSIGSDGVNGPSSWSPNGKWLATLSDTPVDLWDAATGQQVLTYEGHSASVLIVAWSPDSRYVASASADLDVRVWKAANGQTEYVYRGHMNPFQWFFQGGLVPGTTDANQSLWLHSTVSAESLRKIASVMLPHDSGALPVGIRALAWAPNGRYLASGGSDNTVQVWQPG